MAKSSAKVWINPDEVAYKLVAITRTDLIIANPDETELDEVADAIQAGDLDLLGPKDLVISWDEVVKIQSNRKAVDIDVTYKEAGDEESKNVDFASKSDRDQFFKLIRKKPDGEFEYTEKELNRFQASLQPLAWMAGIGFLTFVFYMAAADMAEGEEVDVSGRRGGMKRLVAWLIGLIGPTGVLIFGAILIAICFAVLIMRAADPPINMKLARSRGNRSRRRER